MDEMKVAIVPVTDFQQNCTLIWNDETKTGAVFDPGGELDKINSAIEQTGITVETIYLTHGHIDHAAGAMDLKEALGVDIVGPHEADKPLLENLEKQAEMFGLSGQVRNVTPDKWLDEGDTISIGQHKFEIFHCPGHAPGHVVFYNAPAKFAHVGDVLFSGSIGRTDLMFGDHDTLITSIKTKLLTWPDDVNFVCGHGPASSIGQERATNPFLQ